MFHKEKMIQFILNIQISHLKTKLRNTGEQYNNINVPYKERNNK